VVSAAVEVEVDLVVAGLAADLAVAETLAAVAQAEAGRPPKREIVTDLITSREIDV
jgi:hypothetical protein